MGAWSHESFGHDGACDWLADLQEGSDLRPIEAALGGDSRGAALA
jgi:Domain of unknown function (DUF4259)